MKIGFKLWGTNIFVPCEAPNEVFWAHLYRDQL